jgi:serine protease
MLKHIFTLLLLGAMGNVFAQNNTAPDSTAGLKAYKLMQIPGLDGRVSVSKPIVVAVVDDGFLLTHRMLRNYIYTNTKELPNNGVDEDGNGYVDDVQGFDVSDHDHNVSVPKGDEQIYYHGTMIAGVIVRVAEMAFGPDAHKLVRILPVKALSDVADKTYIKDGYEGIKYALTQNPDIIVCAWSGGTYDNKYQPLFTKATNKGIAIFGSAGNFYTEQVDAPASLPTVYAIAAIDSNLHKLSTSNYGKKIALVASGDLVYAPHPIADNANSFIDGTSASVALVAGAATVLKVMKPDATSLEIITALKNTATSIDGANPSYAGKLGAGVPNVGAAINYLLNDKGRDAYFDSTRPEGSIVIDANTARQQWLIQAQGGVRGIWFYLGSRPKSAENGVMSIYQGDSLILTTSIGQFSGSQFVPGSNAAVTYVGKRSKYPLIFNYELEPIDSSILYCSETINIPDSLGTITDGSGTDNYANKCNCKWLITAPADKRIRLEFVKFDTQAKVDFVHIFAGNATLQENTLAMFSGPGKPPVIISPTNQVLVWFVTDETQTGQGWQLNYSFTDELPFVEKAGE